MKRTLLPLLSLVWMLSAAAQVQTFDLVSYTAPKGWKKVTGKNTVSYTIVNNAKKTWCRLTVFKSTASKGTIEADFNSEWEGLVLKDNTITAGPQKSDVSGADGWQLISGGGKGTFNGSDMMVVLTTFSGHQVCVSILAQTNSADYLGAIEDFTSSLDLKKPATASQPLNQSTNTGSVKGRYTFTTTNFDDGWTSTANEDWTEVAKGNTRVLVHFPNQQADAYNSVLKDGLLNAWNILVAPRYSNVRNFELKPIQSFESIAFAEADATEKSSGRQVHIVLFKKHYSKGNGRYLEFVTPDKRTFEQEFGAYHNDEFGWDKPANMQFRNQFAVHANDLAGKWSVNDYASLSYYYVSSGRYAGATATSTADEFVFAKGGTYQSDHAGASGMVGNQQFSRQVYKGKFSVNNWTLTLTNRFKGATEQYSCYFEAVKGGRILVMTDKLNTVYALAKQQ